MRITAIIKKTAHNGHQIFIGKLRSPLRTREPSRTRPASLRAPEADAYREQGRMQRRAGSSGKFPSSDCMNRRLAQNAVRRDLRIRDAPVFIDPRSHKDLPFES